MQKAAYVALLVSPEGSLLKPTYPNHLVQKLNFFLGAQFPVGGFLGIIVLTDTAELGPVARNGFTALGIFSIRRAFLALGSRFFPVEIGVVV